MCRLTANWTEDWKGYRLRVEVKFIICLHGFIVGPSVLALPTVGLVQTHTKPSIWDHPCPSPPHPNPVMLCHFSHKGCGHLKLVHLSALIAHRSDGDAPTASAEAQRHNGMSSGLKARPDLTTLASHANTSADALLPTETMNLYILYGYIRTPPPPHNISRLAVFIKVTLQGHFQGDTIQLPSQNQTSFLQYLADNGRISILLCLLCLKSKAISE